MRAAYADPPYIGQAAKHYADHPDYAGEVDHEQLLKKLEAEYDGWLLHCSTPSLSGILRLLEYRFVEGYRVMAWVKPFCAFKKNVSVAYAWEPVIVKPVRKPVVTHRVVMRDFIEEEGRFLEATIEESAIKEGIALRKGLSGAKPPKVIRWGFEMLGLQPDDELDDCFPGTGIVGRTWDEWRLDVDRPDAVA